MPCFTYMAFSNISVSTGQSEAFKEPVSLHFRVVYWCVSPQGPRAPGCQWNNKRQLSRPRETTWSTHVELTSQSVRVSDRVTFADKAVSGQQGCMCCGVGTLIDLCGSGQQITGHLSLSLFHLFYLHLLSYVLVAYRK